ncbi:YqaJ viral recombinase family protein [Sphingomonas xinjiangensis]|uniref:Putative phage-related endonuclease n=1 Tax=Sphingomonas xinjiangensis TaxID=643568 RepID=A0A840Y8X5_9SPHN|nr:putative phage-related endonuclease [Sphingomonas xinjiangensis]
MNAPASFTDAQFRASVVGAGEVSALFGVNPWLTEFELWHRKTGDVGVPEFNALRPDGTPENERIYCGVKLEPVIIEMAKERWGYTAREQVKHLTNGNGLGGHPDRRVICPDRGPGILEVKMVDWLERKKWGDEPPTHYLIQNQTYQGLDGVSWGDVIVLVGGNSLERHQYDFRPKLYAEVQRRVADFWQSVRDGNAPKPDYSRDGDTLVEVLGTPTDELADLRDNLEAEQAAMEWTEARARRFAAEADEATAKARLIEMVGTAGAALLPSFRVSCNMTKGSSGTLITDAMVGTTINARKGYRRFDIKERNA